MHHFKIVNQCRHFPPFFYYTVILLFLSIQRPQILLISYTNLHQFSCSSSFPKKNLHQIMSFVEFCSSIFVFLSQDLLSLEQFRRNTRSFSGNLLIRLFLLLCLFTINQNFEFNKANFI